MFNIANFIFRSGPDVATFPPHCTLKVQAQQGAGGLVLLRPHRPLAEASPGRQAALTSSLGRYVPAGPAPWPVVGAGNGSAVPECLLLCSGGQGEPPR